MHQIIPLGGGVQLNNLASQPQPTSQSSQFQFQARPQFPTQPSPITSGAGDIVLDNTPPKKSKKIIIGTVSVIVAVAIIVPSTLFLINTIIYNSANSSKLFNSYANYLLFGDTIDTPIDIDVNNVRKTIYALDCEDKTSSECKDFFKKAETLLNSFKNSNYKEGLSEKSILKIESYFSTFNEYRTYLNSSELDDNSILNYYMKNDYDNTVEYIENYYNNLISNDDASLALSDYGYYGYEIEKAKLTLDGFWEIDQAGCLINGQYDQACMETFTYSPDLEKRIIEFGIGAGNNIPRLIKRMRNDLVYGAISITDLLLNNGGNNEEV